MRTNIQIQVRMGSTRLPGKAMLPIGDCHLLEWVILRCEGSKRADDIVVCHGDRPENDAIAELCGRNGWTHLSGAEDNLLARHHEAAVEYDADRIVRICGDSPLVPPKEIDRVIQTHQRNDADYTTNAVEAMVRGIAVDVINVDVLDALLHQGETHPVTPLRSENAEWTVVTTTASHWSDLAELDLSVDTPADYWTMRDAFEEVGDDPQEVAEWIAAGQSQG